MGEQEFAKERVEEGHWVAGVLQCRDPETAKSQTTVGGQTCLLPQILVMVRGG